MVFFPVMEEMTVFNCKLSSIMEKLLVSAVTEIQQLVYDHCVVLRVELSREKQDNSALMEELELYRPVHGFVDGPEDENREAELQLHAEKTQSCTEWRDEEATVEEQEEGTFMLADCKLEPITFKCEATSEEPQLKAPPVNSSCSHVEDSSQHQDTAVQSSHFCSEPQEGSKDPHTGSKQSLRTQHQLSISNSSDEFLDLGFHIKQESQSPDIQTPGEDLGPELRQGILCQILRDSGSEPVGRSTVTCFNSLDLSGTLTTPDVSLNTPRAVKRDTSTRQEKLRRGESRSCDNAALGTNNRGTRHFKYQCDFCGKGFPYLSLMEGHRLTHTKERTHVCGHCGTSFIRRSHLRRHEKVHLGIQPFTCQICNRKFSQKNNLDAHMKTHS